MRKGWEEVGSGGVQGQVCRALWAMGRTWALALSEVGAKEASEERMGMAWLRCSQAPSGCC